MASSSRSQVQTRTASAAARLAWDRPSVGVRYVTTAALVNELVEAADQRALSRLVGRYGRLDLLLLDELGYVQVDPRGAELLFQIITEREGRAAVAIGTNLPFSKAPSSPTPAW